LVERDMELLATTVGSLPASKQQWRRAVGHVATAGRERAMEESRLAAAANPRLYHYTVPEGAQVNRLLYHRTVQIADSRAVGRFLTGQGLRGVGHDGVVAGEAGACLLCGLASMGGAHPPLAAAETADHIAFDCPWYSTERRDSLLSEFLSQRDPLLFRTGAPWPGQGGWSRLRRSFQYWGALARRQEAGYHI
jgi:hypothetical protein